MALGRELVSSDYKVAMIDGSNSPLPPPGLQRIVAGRKGRLGTGFVILTA